MYFLLDNNFPPVEKADKNGLLAVGADLSVETLLKAYKNGIFPWFNEDEPIFWWSPNPRLVLYPDEVKISRSMKQMMKKNIYSITTNQAFENVIRTCQKIRAKNEGTWISEDIVAAYTNLHKAGFATSVEVWENQELVGGFYGVNIGKAFFGESMFSLKSNASKLALIYWCEECIKQGIKIIDCQLNTKHLVSMGAREIPRNKFIEEIKKGISAK